MKVREGPCTKATVIIQFRVTPKQLDLIENKKNSLGYTTRSAMIKELLLRSDLATHQKLNEIISLIKGIKNG
jgi:hypothetical protein